MRIEVKNPGGSIERLMRDIGYKPDRYTPDGELSAVRKMGATGFPRFHIYVKESRGGLTLNLHLDQKRPSYGEHTAHSGDYESLEVKSELERINDILSK
jgi:hypothetical protein